MRIALLPSIVGCLVLVQSTHASLVGHWTFSEGSGDQVADSSGNGNNGTIVNLKSNTWTSGIIGQALYFDGTTGAGSTYVSIPDSPALAITSAISFAAWARVDDIYRDAPILDKEGPGLGRCYWFGADGGAGAFPDNDLPGKYGLLLNLNGNTGNSGWSFWGRNQGNLIAGQWIHLATTWDGTNIVYYTNGVPFQTVPFSGTLNVSSAFLSIGVNSLFNDQAFDGAIADLRLYNNALTAGDVAALALAPPYIVSQPINQTVINGNTATFSVVAGGASPLTYQWSLNGTNIVGATNASLVLTNVQMSQAGSYSVQVTDLYGAINSADAILTVESMQAALVGHWTFSEGGGDQVADSSGNGNNGTIVNLKSNTWTSGIIGQALYFDGTTGAGSTYVSIPDSPSLAITSAISFAAWARVDDIYRDAPILDKEGSGLGRCYWFGADGGAGTPPDNNLPGKYGLLLNLTGNTGNSGWSFWGRNQGNLIAGQWIHLATTWDGMNIVYYTNGVAFQTVPFSGTLNVSSAFLSIGVNSLFNDRAFDGAIADVRLYNSALTASDVATLALAPPYIDSQPVNQTVINGNTATFSVVAGGTPPLAYQWSFNGTNIVGASSASLVLTNVQMSQAGSYSVQITNIYGAINSTGAILTVNPVPSIIQAATLNATSGIVVLPINLLSQGNENALQFSISFDPTLLTFIGANLGGGATNGSSLANLNQIGSGKLGLLISLPSDTTFSAGTQELAEVSFFVAPVTNTNAVAVSFGDQPTPRQVSSPLPSFLSAAYINGSIVIPPLGIEGDVFPIPNGDGSVGAIDFVQMGRFVAGLDVITNASEFQRADCAPRATLGDGQLTVADWVQAGRYAAVLDPLVAAGGPTQPQGGGGLLVKGGPRTGTSRTLIVPPAAVQAGQSFQLPVQLASQGDENGLEFSLVFDSSKFSYLNTIVGSNASGAGMRVNTNSAAAGSLGIVMTLPTGATFAVATQEVARVTFGVAPSASGNTSVSFGARPLPQQVVSALAVDLLTSYENDSISITAIARPTLNAVVANGNLSLSWPVSANGFGLESSSSLSSTNWTSVLTASVTNASVVTVTVPATTPQNFYRLRLP